MRFLLDVNVGGSLSEWLTDLGHDVVEVRHENPRMEDDEILSWAVNDRRIIITTDHDFEEMIWRESKSHCGIIRLENLPRKERECLLADVINGFSQEIASGAIVIALSNKFRVRKPPK
jgi:predicted nuclease of predicted toxin-antitoxin system